MQSDTWKRNLTSHEFCASDLEHILYVHVSLGVTHEVA